MLNSISIQNFQTYNKIPLAIKKSNHKVNNTIAFNGILDYSIKSNNPYHQAEVFVNRYATSAAATAGALANTGVGDAAALTVITRSMCRKIFKTHGLPYGGYTATIGSTIVGAMVGTNLASTILTIWPKIGNAANATITYGLHQLTGRALNNMCNELTKSGEDISHLKLADLACKYVNFLEMGLSGVENKHVMKYAKKFIEKFMNRINNA